MTPAPRLALAACLLAASCGEPVVEAAGAAVAVPPVHELALGPGRSLRAYSFEGGNPVPWPAAGAPAGLAFGELGRTPRTGLYLTFNAELTAEQALQPAGYRVEAPGARPVAGRFGGGLRLDAQARLRASLPEEARTGGIWSVEFWLRPLVLEERELLELPGLLRVRCTPGGFLRADVPQVVPRDDGTLADLSIHHPLALQAGQWNHVGVVLDLVDLRALRVVVNGEPYGQRFEPGLLAARPQELLLGDTRGARRGLECELDELRLLLRNASTAELAQHWRAAMGPVERLHLVLEGGEEVLELWREPQLEPLLDTPAEFARGELVHAVAGERGLVPAAEHWETLATPDPPAPRTTHPIVSLGGQRVFTYGGETRDTHWGRMKNTDDTWIFDGATNLWERIPTARAPSGRCHVPAAFSPEHDLVLLVGGLWNETDDNRRSGEVWAYRPEQRSWEPRSTGAGANSLPPQISDCGLVYLPERRRFLLLGHRKAWLYDPAQDSWQRQPGLVRCQDEAGQELAFDFGASFMCARDPATGLVWLFGGERDEGPEHLFGDATSSYDVGTNTLTVLRLEVQPPARVRAGFAHDPRRARFVLFGGVRDQHSTRFDDLWTFDPAARRWREFPPVPSRPSRRGGFFGMAYDEVADRFVLPSGRHEHQRWEHETMALRLDEEQAGSARYVFDRAGFADGLGWFAQCETPGDSRVTFRFRVSADGRRFGPWEESAPPTGRGAARFVQVEVRLQPGAGGVAPRVLALGFREAP